MLKKIGNDVTTLKEGLDPENLAYWYQKIIHETREMAPPWLTDKINVKQDPILHMKFNIDISKRAVRYLIIIIDNNLDNMFYFYNHLIVNNIQNFSDKRLFSFFDKD